MLLITVSVAIPETRTGGMQAGSILLHDDTRYCIIQRKYVSLWHLTIKPYSVFIGWVLVVLSESLGHTVHTKFC